MEHDYQDERVSWTDCCQEGRHVEGRRWMGHGETSVKGESWEGAGGNGSFELCVCAQGIEEVCLKALRNSMV